MHVAGNYYSVPFLLVGKKVTVRLAERDVTVPFDGERVALHARALGRGQSVTDMSHYPPTKRLATLEIHRRRVEAVRSVGPHTVEYLGRLRHGRWVFGDQVARLHRLLGRGGDQGRVPKARAGASSRLPQVPSDFEL